MKTTLKHDNREYFYDDIESYSFKEPNNDWEVWLCMKNHAIIKLVCDNKIEWKILMAKLGENIL